MKAQDPVAWERLAELYGPLVFRWCRQTGLQSQDAADVVQEVFATVATRVSEFRHAEKRGSFRAWLRAIARNKIGDHLRRLKDRPQAQGGSDAQELLLRIPEPPDPPSVSDQAQENGLLSHRALELVRAEFEDRTWLAFWRVAVEGQSPACVAETLGMTLYAVYKAKSRVLCRLRQELDDWLE